MSKAKMLCYVKPCPRNNRAKIRRREQKLLMERNAKAARKERSPNENR